MIDPFFFNKIWLTPFFFSFFFFLNFYSVAKQSTNLASISSSNIKDLKVLVPPVEERHKIMIFLNDRLSKMDALIQKSNYSINLLKERRTALISAAVTGKIDVRNIAWWRVNQITNTSSFIKIRSLIIPTIWHCAWLLAKLKR